jgi:hypothetical protein
MKKFSSLLVAAFLFVYCQNCIGSVNSTNDVTSLNNQNMQGQGWSNSQSQGGDSYSQGGDSYAQGGASYSAGGESVSASAAVAGDSSASSQSGDATSVSFNSMNSVSNYKGRTPPISTTLPYLPSWTHGGWGTLQAYFPNGPSSNTSYERVFYPGNREDMKELKGVINAIPYDGPLNFIGGIFNGLGSCLGAPDNFHHGRGFEISSSIERRRRPEGKPLLIFIDSNINRAVLNESGYTYVGRISIEGKAERNWDQTYRAAIAEAVPWDVDMIIVSGGMKGITVGSNFSFPTAAGAYSQLNYSLSLFGGASGGTTEGKGVAMVSAECYRFYPMAQQQRAIPQYFYDKIHTASTTKQSAAPEKSSTTTETAAEPARQSTITDKSRQAPASSTTRQVSATPQSIKTEPVVPDNNGGKVVTQRSGIEISQELYNMSGFNSQQQIDYLVVK